MINSSYTSSALAKQTQSRYYRRTEGTPYFSLIFSKSTESQLHSIHAPSATLLVLHTAALFYLLSLLFHPMGSFFARKKLESVALSNMYTYHFGGPKLDRDEIPLFSVREWCCLRVCCFRYYGQGCRRIKCVCCMKMRKFTFHEKVLEVGSKQIEVESDLINTIRRLRSHGAGLSLTLSSTDK